MWIMLTRGKYFKQLIYFSIYNKMILQYCMLLALFAIRHTIFFLSFKKVNSVEVSVCIYIILVIFVL